MTLLILILISVYFNRTQSGFQRFSDANKEFKVPICHEIFHGSHLHDFKAYDVNSNFSRGL